MRKVLENTDRLTIRQAEFSNIITDENNNITGVTTVSGATYNCKAVII